MKKIFTIAASMLFAATTLWAETETSANTGSSNVAVSGISYTIPGTYVAGAGGTKVDPMPNKGIKVRMNQTVGETANALQVKVNEGYKITAIQLIGVTNSDNKAITLASIYVDGVAYAGSFDTTIVAKNATTAATIALTGIEATSDIVYVVSNLNGATQANICLVVTYEINKATYTVTYKSNDEADSTFVAENVFKVADCMFDAKVGLYFDKWNTKAEGDGDEYVANDDVESNLTLFAQWNTFALQTALYLDTAIESTPLNVDDEVIVKKASFGGKIIVAGMKSKESGKESIGYNKSGLSLSGGAADSIRVVLNRYIKAGSIIQLQIYAKGKDASTPYGLKLLSGKAVQFDASWIPSSTEKYEAKVFTYVVPAESPLIEKNEFILQRNNSVYLQAIAAGELANPVPTAVDNIEANTKAVKFIENGQIFILRDGKVFNLTGARVK